MFYRSWSELFRAQLPTFSIRKGTFSMLHCFDWSWRKSFASFPGNFPIWCRWGNLELTFGQTKRTEEHANIKTNKQTAYVILLLSFALFLGIILDLMHLKKLGGFDISLFYRDIINVAEDEDLGIQPDESGKLEHLMKKVRAKETRKRALVRCVPSYCMSFNRGHWC